MKRPIPQPWSILALIGEGTPFWVNVRIREHARIGATCILWKQFYTHRTCQLGTTEVQNSVSIYKGITVEDEVFVSRNACWKRQGAAGFQRRLQDDARQGKRAQFDGSTAGSSRHR